MSPARLPGGVVHLTAEYWPFAQTGGLAYAVAGLAAHQARAGLSTTVILPMYHGIRARAAEFEPACEPFALHAAGLDAKVHCWRLPAERRRPRVLFVDVPAAFDRLGLYGESGADYPDNARRFGLFSLAALECIARLPTRPAVVHAHDWHTALATVFLGTVLKDRPEFGRLATVLTVHNAGFQGHFGREMLAILGLPEHLWAPEWMEWYGRLNYLKGGLRFADLVSTVSPTHAVELCSDVGGFGLQDVFRALGDRLVGIRNGIEGETWDPAHDAQLEATYSAAKPEGKARCKAALQREAGLEVAPDAPLFGMSARLVGQKGLDLILGSKVLNGDHSQFVFLGAGEARYTAALAALAAAQPHRIAVNFDFNDAAEHRLLAGADFLLMPSLYEPCGLTQMRAQHYGALPIGRRVGGLADTITVGETGILFDGYASDDLDRALAEAAELHADAARRRTFVRTAMRRDFSWKGPAAQYLELYARAAAAH
jgi:starch synthase